MIAAETPEEVISLLQCMGIEFGALIGIDGVDGVGKTTLAFDLARRMAGIRVGLDCYVDQSRDSEGYVGLLRIEDLARDVSALLRSFPCVVVDGVCLLEALSQAGLTPTKVIYVKKTSLQGIWHDGHHLEDFASGTFDAGWLDRSVYSSHLEHMPHTSASIIYTWSAP